MPSPIPKERAGRQDARPKPPDVNRLPMVLWDRRMLGYDFGANHPMNPLRWELTWLLAGSLGVLDGFHVIIPQPADAESLGRIHTFGYIDPARRASRPGFASASGDMSDGTPHPVSFPRWDGTVEQRGRPGHPGHSRHGLSLARAGPVRPLDCPSARPPTDIKDCWRQEEPS